MSLFITFEGTEGCGKSTQIKLLSEYLKERGVDTLLLREPGGTKLGERIREILLNVTDEPIDPYAELLLYGAARAQLVSSVIVGALEEGKTVLCDRFTDSTLAYQGFARRLSTDVVTEINEMATAGLIPDLTVILNIDPEEGLRRALKRIDAAGGGEPAEDRFEREAIEFHKRVRHGYHEIARADPGRVKLVDGAGTLEEVRELVKGLVDTLL
ncbi:MAG: dTMP kinase [Thermodesulfobacteriota bacterium]